MDRGPDVRMDDTALRDSKDDWKTSDGCGQKGGGGILGQGFVW